MKAQKTKLVRIRPEAHKMLRLIAVERNIPMSILLDDAVKLLDKQQRRKRN